MSEPLAAQSAFAGLSSDQMVTQKPHSISGYVRYGFQKAHHHLKSHFGVGIVCAVAYFDPGNWSVDMQAGSTFGYRPMLFVILIASLGAVIFQTMACRLGVVTGLDLAAHCRLLLYNRPKHRRLWEYLALYPLYVLCELAIISTDLAELLGSAIGINLLIPSLPLWAAVLITASDVLIFLVIGDPTRGRGKPVRVFELTVTILVFVVFAAFIVLLARVNANWGQVFLGFVPSQKLFESHPDALYTAVGILGATVMPHALFLGSFLATHDRVGARGSPIPPPVSADEPPRMNVLRRTQSYLAGLFEITRKDRIAADREHRNHYAAPENNSVHFIDAHLGHGIADIVLSLLGFAVPINSAILIIAATVFFAGNMQDASDSAGLFEAHGLIKTKVGNFAGVLFAVALLSAGQTASITATLAGQIVSEGFIEWKISPFLRRLITRTIGLVPSMAVAIGVGRKGINTLLVASQVSLAIVLPFIVIPLVWLTSSSAIMSVTQPPPPSPRPSAREILTEHDGLATPMSNANVLPPTSIVGSELEIPSEVHEIAETTLPAAATSKEEISHIENEKLESQNEKLESQTGAVEVAGVEVKEGPDYQQPLTVDYSNSWFMKWLGYLICLIVLAANVYTFVVLGLGDADV